MFTRIIIIILDACGVGELPDASLYGDTGAATIPNIARARGGLHMPNCGRLGLGNIVDIKGIPTANDAIGGWGKMAEKSPGKDSTSGHWEIGGVILERPFPVYPDGFPADLVAEFEKRAGVKIIGNLPASGTEIIKELGEQHLKTGNIILYTSADSVFQLAAHEEIIPLNKLYEICKIARQILKGEHAVGRVIARPFTGKPGNFQRTPDRRDYSLEPTSETILDILQKNNIATTAIGKIDDLFAHRGMSRVVEAHGNNEVLEKIMEEINRNEPGLIFANLVDFDMLWGHRNDIDSFAKGLEQFDLKLENILSLLNDNDLLLMTADHGCDPTLKNSTDHTREYVPLLVYSRLMKRGVNLGIRSSFSDVAQTIAENFKIKASFPGKSFLKDIVETCS